MLFLLLYRVVLTALPERERERESCLSKRFKCLISILSKVFSLPSVMKFLDLAYELITQLSAKRQRFAVNSNDGYTQVLKPLREKSRRALNVRLQSSCLIAFETRRR